MGTVPRGGRSRGGTARAGRSPAEPERIRGVADLFLLVEPGRFLHELTITITVSAQRSAPPATWVSAGAAGSLGSVRAASPDHALGTTSRIRLRRPGGRSLLGKGEPPENENSDRPERKGEASGQAAVTWAWRCPSLCVPGPGAAPARSPVSGPVDVGVPVPTVSRRLYVTGEGEGIHACGSGDRFDFAGRDHARPNNGAASGSESEMGTTAPGRNCRPFISPCGPPLPSACASRRSAMTPTVPLPARRPSRSAASP